MKKDDLMIGTLPIKPQGETNIGMMVAPTIMDYIGDVFEIEKNIGFNTLHSYDDKDVLLDEYLGYVNKSGINYDSMFIDGVHGDELLKIVEDMYYSGFLVAKNKEILRCDCGRIDMVYSPNNNAKLYTIKDDKIYCKYCGSECRKSIEKTLVYEVDSEKNMSVVPLFLNKELSTFSDTFNDNDILVSKMRDTGYNIDTKEGLFNIDIDFLWMNYFKLFDKNNQIYIASNHQIFPMYLMNYIARKTSDKNLSFIASPYINVNMEEAKRQYEIRKLKEYKSLLLLYNLKWKNKVSNWSDSTCEYLTNISDTRLKNLYKTMVLSGEEVVDLDISLDKKIYKILNEKTNMQNNIKTMKKLFREGKL